MKMARPLWIDNSCIAVSLSNMIDSRPANLFCRFAQGSYKMMTLSSSPMKYLFYTLITFPLLLSSGCATQGINSVSHKMNVPEKVEYEKIFDKPYSEVLNELVNNLTESAYVIERIGGDSNLINVSFASNYPDKYVDCGETTRTYTQGNDIDTYIYNPAKNVGYRLAAKSQSHPYLRYFYFIKRKTFLQTQSNIYIINNNNKTKLSVETIYYLDIEVTGQSYAQPSDGNPFKLEKLPSEKTSIVFKTNSPATEIDTDGEKMTCSSKGTLEKQILSMVNN